MGTRLENVIQSGSQRTSCRINIFKEIDHPVTLLGAIHKGRLAKR